MMFQIRLCKKLRFTFQEITHFVITDNLLLPRQSPQATRVAYLHAFDLDLYKIVGGVKDVQQGSEASIHTEYQLLSTDYTSLLTALLPRLVAVGARLNAKVTASSISFPTSGVMSEFWELLAVASSAFHQATLSWHRFEHVATQCDFPHLYTACHALLTWLLPFTRSPAWKCTVLASGPLQDKNYLVAFLAVSTLCLANFTAFNSDTFARHLCLLSPTYVPTLCCVVSEQFGFTDPQIAEPQPTETAQPTNTRQGDSIQTLQPVCVARGDILECCKKNSQTENTQITSRPLANMNPVDHTGNQ